MALQVISGSMWSEVRLAYGLLPMLNVLDRHAVAAESMLERAGIARFGLMDPAYTIRIEQELGFLRAAIRAMPDPALSLELAAEYRLRGFSVLGLAMQACRTPLHLLGLMLKYPRLAWGVCNARIELGAHALTAELTPPAALGTVGGFLAERDLACALVIVNEALQAPFGFERLEFSHPCRGDPAAFEDFFRCPVSFGKQRTVIVVGAAAARQPLPHANDTMLAFYEAQCESMSRQMDRPFRYADALRARLLRSTPIPDLNQLAAQMFMTPRTLQRRLATENASFTVLLRDVRRQRAEQLLVETRRSMEGIAAELGFSDAVAFSHAYKAWTGQAPRQRRCSGQSGRSLQS